MTIVPSAQLQPETLDALIEEFVTRDGAIHGHADSPLSAMIAAVRRQLGSGEALIVFDEESESCSIVLKDELGSPSTAPDDAGFGDDRP